jgi:hypothetical protein
VVEWLRLEAIASTLAANQDEFSNAWQFFLPCKERQSFYRRWLMLLDCVSACKTVLFKFVPCALQLHTLIRRKSPVDPIVHRGKSLGVFGSPDLQGLFQILAAWAIHFALRNISFDLRYHGNGFPLLVK